MSKTLRNDMARVAKSDRRKRGDARADKQARMIDWTRDTDSAPSKLSKRARRYAGASNA